jgi:hypothetical protein
MTFFLCGNVRFLSSNERPNFVALDTLASQVAKSLVLKFGARFAEIGQKFHYRRAVNASHAGRCAKRISLYQAGNHPSAFFCGNLVHKFKVALMLERSGI